MMRYAYVIMQIKPNSFPLHGIPVDDNDLNIELASLKISTANTASTDG